MHAPLKPVPPPLWPAFRHALLPAALIAVLIVLGWHVEPLTRPNTAVESFVFEVQIASPQAGTACLFRDRGEGFRASEFSLAKVTPGSATARFLVPPGDYAAFRLHPLDQRAPIRFAPVRITTLQGDEIADLRALPWQTATGAVPAWPLDLPAAPDVSLTLRPSNPLALRPPSVVPSALLQTTALAGVLAFLFAKLPPLWSRRRELWRVRFASALATARQHPRVTLLAVAAAAVAVSCHPVLFAGRSFVAPQNGALCLYDDFPTVPGGGSSTLEDPKGSDVGAMMWAHLPYSVIQSRALFTDHELPLWNRANSAGVTLLGQGQSMLGDPLHWIAILGGGASWAWDAKFLLARLLFCFGIGLLVHAVTGRLGIAALLGASAAFLGFFAYRLNHAATFSLCYAPWILVGWLGIARSEGFRAALRPALLLVAAVWMEFHSGTAKESAMLIAGLNFAGALIVLLTRVPLRLRLHRLAAGAVGLVIFLLISAPFWMVFLDALGRAHTLSDRPRPAQIQPALILGLFDDLFYRQGNRYELHTNPSANFLLLLGVLWAAVSARRLASCRIFLALGVAALPPFALAFGLVPPGVIAELPFLGQIQHVDNTFSCVLLVLLFPLAGLGLRACRERLGSTHWRGDWLFTLVGAAALAALYFGGTQAIARADTATAPAALPRSSFFVGYAPVLLLCLGLLPLAARSLLHTRRHMLAAGITAFAALVALHFRHSQYLETKFDAYVLNPQPRVDLAAPSPALEFIAKQSTEPARVAGFGDVLLPGFNAVRGLEHFTGPDAVLNRQYHELLAAAALPTTWEWRHLADKRTYPALQRFYDLLGVRWLLGATADPVKSLPGARLVGTRDLDVFTSPTAWPRAFFTDRLATYESAADFAALVAAGDGRPFAAVQASGPGHTHDWTLPADLPARQVVAAHDYRLTSNTTAFTIDAPAPGLVVLGEAWLEGDFRVTVDGQPAPYVRVNHAFKGVWVGKSGLHRVEFAYHPRRLDTGLASAGVGLIFLCGIALISRRKTGLE